MAGAAEIHTLDFEVYGKVQGVFFRKHTAQNANKLGIKGWCMNTAEGTVKGQIEGTLKNIDDMKYWLKNVGSPTSKIEKAIFKHERVITNPIYTDFRILR